MAKSQIKLGWKREIEIETETEAKKALEFETFFFLNQFDSFSYLLC